MTISRGFGRFGYLGLSIGISVAGAFFGCSKDQGPGTVQNPDSGSVPVVTCGELDAAQAATLATSRLEHFGTTGLAALVGLENSRTAARLLSFGYAKVIGTFVAQSQSDLHDSLVKLRDEQLVPLNVESAQNGVVTFLLGPQTLCGESSAPSGSTADPECVKEQTDHPIRIRISRIACDQGDNLEIELLRDSPGQRLIAAQLYADRAEVDLDLGAYLRASTVTTSVMVSTAGTEQITTKPLVSAATGTLHGTLALTGANQGTGSISVSQAIDFTTNDDSPTRIRLAAGTNVATLAADGTARTMTLTMNVGAFDMRQTLAQAVWDVLGMDLVDASDEDPVDIHIPGLRGELKLGSGDVITATKLDLGGGPITMVQGSLSLLSVNAAGAAQAQIAATLSAKADDALAMALPAGLTMALAYGFEPIMSRLHNPANFLSKDTLSISAPANAAVTLPPESSTDQALTITSSWTGTMLRVDSGTLSIKSALWPDDSVSVGLNQCLSRSGDTQTGHNDLLSSMHVAACTP